MDRIWTEPKTPEWCEAAEHLARYIRAIGGLSQATNDHYTFRGTTWRWRARYDDNMRLVITYLEAILD